jgi:hypothetical protein
LYLRQERRRMKREAAGDDEKGAVELQASECQDTVSSLEDWIWVPGGGSRSGFGAYHLASCLLMSNSNAGTFSWSCAGSGMLESTQEGVYQDHA